MGGSFSKNEIKKDSLAREESHAKVLEEPILVCSKTPEGITSLGVAQLPIVMTPCHLMRALRLSLIHILASFCDKNAPPFVPPPHGGGTLI